MFLKSNHQKPDICEISGQFVLEYYKLSHKLPVEEKFGMIVQTRRATLSVYLTIAVDLDYLQGIEIRNLGSSIISCFKLLTGMINAKTKSH